MRKMRGKRGKWYCNYLPGLEEYAEKIKQGVQDKMIARLWENFIMDYMDFCHELELYIYGEHIWTGYSEIDELAPEVNGKEGVR